MPPTPTETPTHNDSGALNRALHILRTVADAPTPLSHSELTSITGIPKATVSRILSRLLAAGFLRQPYGSEQYALGPGILDLSRAFLDKLDLREEFRRRFPPIVEQVGAAAHFGLRDQLEMVLLETVQPRAATLVTRLRAGSRMTLLTSAMGRAYLCALPHEEREVVAQTLYQSGRAEPTSFQRQIQQAQEELNDTGFCTSFGEWNPEINAIATWLQAPDGDLFALSCGGPSHQLSRDYLLNEVLPLARQEIQSLCQDIGATTALTAQRKDT